jgi:hypothetical protein
MEENTMKQLFAVLSAAAILVSAAPAFACGGDKAKKGHSQGDDTVMTSTEDGHECSADCNHEKAKKSKEAKKEQNKKKEGEV